MIVKSIRHFVCLGLAGALAVAIAPISRADIPITGGTAKGDAAFFTPRSTSGSASGSTSGSAANPVLFDAAVRQLQLITPNGTTTTARFRATAGGFSPGSDASNPYVNGTVLLQGGLSGVAFSSNNQPVFFQNVPTRLNLTLNSYTPTAFLGGSLISPKAGVSASQLFLPITNVSLSSDSSSKFTATSGVLNAGAFDAKVKGDFIGLQGNLQFRDSGSNTQVPPALGSVTKYLLESQGTTNGYLSVNSGTLRFGTSASSTSTTTGSSTTTGGTTTGSTTGSGTTTGSTGGTTTGSTTGSGTTTGSTGGTTTGTTTGSSTDGSATISFKLESNDTQTSQKFSVSGTATGGAEINIGGVTQSAQTGSTTTSTGSTGTTGSTTTSTGGTGTTTGSTTTSTGGTGTTTGSTTTSTGGTGTTTGSTTTSGATATKFKVEGEGAGLTTVYSNGTVGFASTNSQTKYNFEQASTGVKIEGQTNSSPISFNIGVPATGVSQYTPSTTTSSNSTSGGSFGGTGSSYNSTGANSLILVTNNNGSFTQTTIFDVQNSNTTNVNVNVGGSSSSNTSGTIGGGTTSTGGTSASGSSTAGGSSGSGSGSSGQIGQSSEGGASSFSSLYASAYEVTKFKVSGGKHSRREDVSYKIYEGRRQAEVEVERNKKGEYELVEYEGRGNRGLALGHAKKDKGRVVAKYKEVGAPCRIFPGLVGLQSIPVTSSSSSSSTETTTQQNGSASQTQTTTGSSNQTTTPASSTTPATGTGTTGTTPTTGQ